jgi:hypothetical protein
MDVSIGGREMKEGEYKRAGTVRNGVWYPYQDGELKPCPFCGGDADVKTVDGWAQIYCGDCGCGTPYGRANTWDDARDAWNTRRVVEVAQ